MAVAKARAARLKVAVHQGHKGMALVFPFDPSEKWGKRERHFVGGTLNGVRFIGEIGFRRRVFYTLLDDELLLVVALKDGEEAGVIVAPREGTPEDFATPKNLVWSRLASKMAPAKKRAEVPTRKSLPSPSSSRERQRAKRA